MEILIYSIIPTLIATLLTLYLTEKVKGSVKSKFDKEIEFIKNQHNTELANFQSELDSISNQKIYKFTKLHEKRFEILEQLYKTLNKKLRKLQLYISPVKYHPKEKTFEEYEDDLYKDYFDAHNNFVTLFYDNKIFLTEKITKLIESYLDEESQIFNEYSENYFLTRMGDRPSAETRTKAYTAYKKIPEKILPIKKEIEDEFKEVLNI